MPLKKSIATSVFSKKLAAKLRKKALTPLLKIVKCVFSLKNAKSRPMSPAVWQEITIFVGLTQNY